MPGRCSASLSPACTHAFLQLTETSSRYARKISGTTALQEALKEKQQHIEQLLAERDLERAEVAKATSHICEVEKEIALLKAQHEQVGGQAGPRSTRRAPAVSSGQSCPSVTLSEQNLGCAEKTETHVTSTPHPPGEFPSSGRSTFHLQNLDTKLRVLLFPTSYSASTISRSWKILPRLKDCVAVCCGPCPY